jgi:dipeptidyl aminopeptidase/acylaminoacyl peptidase
MKRMFAAAATLAALAGAAQARELADPAAAFGARESIRSIALSPDGRTLAFVQPAAGQGAVLYTVDIAGGGDPRGSVRSDGVEQRLGNCEFVAARRLVCQVFLVSRAEAGSESLLLTASRLVALDADGSNMRVLGERDSFDQQYQRFFGGRIIDYLPGSEGSVMMIQQFVPDERTGSRMGRRGEGLGVVRIDTNNLRSATIEAPRDEAAGFLTDGRGTVRMMLARNASDATGELSNRVEVRYRRVGSSDWESFGSYEIDPRTGRRRSGAVPVAVDHRLNAAYVIEKLDGRDALYRVSLDGSMRRELVLSHPSVEIDQLIRIGRSNRVVGASFATERRVAQYFDPELRRIAEQLHRALPNLPMINFVDASEDESKLLILATSDTDPGRYYLYDRGTRQLNELMLIRPQLEDVPLASVRPVSYRAADGTQIPAYLTLPPGRANARGLPAIVMPHGGPGARDEWGFDWLAQYFANRGFAVLQPNFRGSAGYGDAWFQQNGFRSWRTAIGDVNDAGRWLVSEGIADPAKLAILGWSYGGYAALQANVLDPALFRAAVAIAPVTDLELTRSENGASLALFDFVGAGAHVREGSPAQNAAAIRAPVLIFHGALDRNVGIRQARLMRDRLHDAGRQVELVEFPSLDHQLDDSAARTRMLRDSDAFLRRALAIQ